MVPAVDTSHNGRALSHGDRALSIIIPTAAISKLSLLVNIDTRIMRGQVHLLITTCLVLCFTS